MLKRREFITLLGGAAAAWPLAARAQQPERMRRIAVLSGAVETDLEIQARNVAFRQALQQLGWTDQQNVQIDYRWVSSDNDHIRRVVAELVALTPDVILATGSPNVGALHKATRTVPIVFVGVIDPVGAGIVDSLARPAGNLTGFTWFEYGVSGKWVELLKEIAPRVRRAAVLRDPASPGGSAMVSAVSRSSSSRPRGTLRCVERCCPSAAQARRSETCMTAWICSIQARRRAGLRSFPGQPPAE